MSPCKGVSKGPGNGRFRRSPAVIWVAPTSDSWNRIEAWLSGLDHLGEILGIDPPAGVGPGRTTLVNALPSGFGTMDEGAVTRPYAIPGPHSAGAPGSEVSLRDLPEGVDLELLVGDDALETGVLLGQVLEALGVVCLEAPILLAPPVIGLLRDLEVLGDLGDLFAAG